ncbi:attractin-like protein 1 isoform X2, partial [Lates japonicus]
MKVRFEPEEDDIYMFGGKLEAGSANVTDEMWVFNIPRRTWSPLKPAPPPPYALEGHTAHVVELADGEPVMLILFGYSPVYSYINKVQEYSIRSNSWQVVSAGGAMVQGGYGHSSLYDEASGCVFVHGGYKALNNNNKYGLVDHMYRYHIHTRTWLILRESGLARYLHSAVLLSGTVLVFGGNTHNDTSLNNGAKCFSADFLAYDIACDEWTVLPKPGLHRDVNRWTLCRAPCTSLEAGLLLNACWPTPPSCQAFSNSAHVLLPGQAFTLGQKQINLWSQNHLTTLHAAILPCTTPSVRDSSRCKRREEQECFRLANCRSCSLNINCQWDQQQQESQALPGQLCGEGWHHVEEACLRINSSRESYDNAQHYCKNLGGNIASLLTDKQVNFVLEELQKYQLHDKRLSPWVGLRKINVSYWGWEDASPFTNTSLRWLPGEPSDSGFCAYLERAQVAGLKANPCTATTDGLICEKPA